MHAVANPGIDEPNDLAGQDVILDGKVVRVVAVEAFAIYRPYPHGMRFAVGVRTP
jgi:hypothetical protein